MSLIVCPDCSRGISSEALACPHCGKPSRQVSLLARQAPRVKPGIKAGIIGALVIIAFALAYWLDKGLQPGRESEIKLGDTVSLIGNSTTAFVAVDLDSLRKLETSISAKDKTGFAELYTSGKIIDVQSGTQGRVLDFGGAGGVQVRILNGRYTEQAVWTDMNWIKK